MNISGDLSVSEFKTERYVEAVPIKKGGGFVGKSSFLDLIKNLQGSVQKGLDETLTEIQNTLSKTEDSAVRPEENVENIDEKKTEIYRVYTLSGRGRTGNPKDSERRRRNSND